MSEEQPAPICGIVMPISVIDTCSEEHWRDVKGILEEAIEDAGFTPQLVSDADDVGIIQKRIIQNLYENPIVVVDVSAKNPNVMFELGLRLAFDKPAVIIKDDKTAYSFDTSPVEHLTYPRDLRFGRIVEFKDALAEKIRATAIKSQEDPSYTTFLKHFGTFKVAALTTEVVPQDQIVLEEIKSLREVVSKLVANSRSSAIDSGAGPVVRTLCLQKPLAEAADALESELKAAGFQFARPKVLNNGHTHFRFVSVGPEDKRKIMSLARKHIPEANWLNGAVPRSVDV